MADTPVNLHALTLTAIQNATQALAGGGNVRTWEREMERILARAHTAAYLAGQAERLGVGLEAFKGLSRAERSDIAKTVKGQLDYLTGFAGDVQAGRLSPAQIAARADLYAGPVRATYSKARNPGLPFYPADGGTPCLANCRCSWRQEDEVYYWELSAAEHCSGCLDREARNPYRVEAA